MRMLSFPRVLSLISFAIALVLVAMPFHAFLSVWLSQLIGHYTLVRLWKEVVLLALIIGSVGVLMQDATLRQTFLRSWLVRLIGVYIFLQVLCGVAAYTMHGVSLMAFGYGLISNTRYLLFFLCVIVIAIQAPRLRQRWQQLLFWPMALVILISLMQYFVLPYDVLRHFGYGPRTIFPYEDINHNLHYLRVMATLRGANPLGAYIVLCVSVLLVRYRARWWWYGLCAGGIAVLVLTFSRGAWLGLCTSVVCLAFAYLRTRHPSRQVYIYGSMAAVLVLLSAALLYRTTTFQNVFLHTQKHSAVATTSNQGHVSALRQGLRDIVHEPLGRGTGTAGPASVYNTGHAPRIAENYFIQIAQESGWLGLMLFVAIQCMLACVLWRQRHNPLALGLWAALIGLAVVNLFSHAWADDTLAYLWWGLAALATAPAILRSKAT